MHRVVNALTTGSTGDLGRIARRLADNGININAVGGGEGAVATATANATVGIIAMLVTSDEDPGALQDLLLGLELDGGRTLDVVDVYPALDVELGDAPGTLATAAEALGNAEINIMGVMSVDVHLDWAVVSIAFADAATQEEARHVLEGADGVRVLPEHGGEARRLKVDERIKGVRRGDPV